MDRNFSSNETDGFECRTYHGFEIDLGLEEDELFSRMKAVCRTCIRKARKSGVVIEEARDSESFADEYYAQLRDVFGKQELVPTYDLGRVRALIKWLNPTGNLLLLQARDTSGKCIATGIFPALHQRAFFWGAASFRSEQILRPNELLMWHAILYWKRRAIRFFDMGGSGEYKRKYGCNEIAVPWLRSSRYSVLSQLRLAMASFIRAQQFVRGRWQSHSQHAVANAHRESRIGS